MPYIEKKAGFTFERIGPPQPKDMAAIAAGIAAEKIAEVQDSVVPWFKEAARKLLEVEGCAEAALAKALAKTTGACCHCSTCVTKPLSGCREVAGCATGPAEARPGSCLWDPLPPLLPRPDAAAPIEEGVQCIRGFGRCLCTRKSNTGGGELCWRLQRCSDVPAGLRQERWRPRARRGHGQCSSQRGPD